MQRSMAGQDWAMLVGLAHVFGSAFFLVQLALGSYGPLTVARIRVMLNPLTASDSTLAQVQFAAGTALTVTGQTRTGALEITLAAPADAAVLLQRLRAQRDVLWAEAADTARMPVLRARLDASPADPAAEPSAKPPP